MKVKSGFETYSEFFDKIIAEANRRSKEVDGDVVVDTVNSFIMNRGFRDTPVNYKHFSMDGLHVYVAENTENTENPLVNLNLISEEPLFDENGKRDNEGKAFFERENLGKQITFNAIKDSIVPIYIEYKKDKEDDSRDRTFISTKYLTGMDRKTISGYERLDPSVYQEANYDIGDLLKKGFDATEPSETSLRSLYEKSISLFQRINEVVMSIDNRKDKEEEKDLRRLSLAELEQMLTRIEESNNEKRDELNKIEERKRNELIKKINDALQEGAKLDSRIKAIQEEKEQ